MKTKQNPPARRSARDRFVIIMAGGRGERFWPVSRERRPKQLLDLLGDRSFLQQAVDRVLPLVPRENIFVITNAAQLAAVRRQLPELPKANLVGEPCGRDTCAAVALGAALVGARSPEGVMAVLPADHVIPRPGQFQRVLGDAFQLAARDEVIVTIGITPTEPATGYGYIELAAPLPQSPGGRRARTTFHQVKRFVEKPPLKRAVQYLKSGRHRWNAGMFVWSVPTITNGLARHQPGMAEFCQRWRQAAGTGRLQRTLAADYPALTKVSIDYALLEHAENVVAAEGDFGWDDLGAWTALARHLQADPQGNCSVADYVQVESSGNVVFDARSKSKGLVATVGVRDSIIVLTDDALLVAGKSEAQNIKQLLAGLNAAGRKALL
ncbi:MAG: NTP transferase domain-containing protein [Verrucomicrobiales bacterium]|nr:NTP transferase domain-containing protein [Verrucomicrobiales bacterium]